MVRKCSHCGNNGHNSRTCINPISKLSKGGVKLFGVHLYTASSPVKKSISMDSLSSSWNYIASSSPFSSSPSSSDVYIDDPEKISNANLTVGLASRAYRDRKKGVAWTEEEHTSFLAGLRKLGKGNWRGISRNFVISRTPTQVASHAQKFLSRQTNLNRKKRRYSIFDVLVSSHDGLFHSPPSEWWFNLLNLAGSDERRAANASSKANCGIKLGSSLEQEPSMATCLHLMPGSSPVPDLELSISSRPTHQHGCLFV